MQDTCIAVTFASFNQGYNALIFFFSLCYHFQHTLNGGRPKLYGVFFKCCITLLHVKPYYFVKKFHVDKDPLCFNLYPGQALFVTAGKR